MLLVQIHTYKYTCNDVQHYTNKQYPERPRDALVVLWHVFLNTHNLLRVGLIAGVHSLHYAVSVSDTPTLTPHGVSSLMDIDAVVVVVLYRITLRPHDDTISVLHRCQTLARLAATHQEHERKPYEHCYNHDLDIV